MRSLACVGALMLLCPSASHAAAPEPGGPFAWSPVPREAAASVFLTGSDVGHLLPRGCHDGAGGAIYRAALGRELARERPEHETAWLSAGNFAPVPADEEFASRPRELFALYAMAGYAAVAVGRLDLERVPATDLRDLAATFRVPLVATNLVQLETRTPAFDRSVEFRIGGARVGVLAALEHRPDLAWGDAYSGTIVTVDPLTAVKKAARELASRTDLIVLLSTLSSSRVEELVREVPEIDVVASGWASYARPEAQRIGRARVMWLGDDGLHLGRLSFDRTGTVLEQRISRVALPFPVDPTTGRPGGAPVAASP